MKTQILRVGFIGLGKMGAGICENIQKAGYQLTVFNRTISKTLPFQERGAKVSRSIRELVEQSDIIFTSLLDDKSIIELCCDEGGMLASMTSDKIHVGLTTIQPSIAEHLKLEHEKLGCQYIAAPVVGRPDAAAAGELITFLAGEQKAIEVVKPIIASYTVKQLNVGTVVSSANGMKVCVNYMVMAQLSMLGEVFTFAEKSQLNKRQLLAVIQMFFAGNDAMCSYAEKIALRDFDTVGFDLTAGLKDALIFETAFTACGVKPSAIQGAKDNLVTANANGLGQKDWSALTEVSRLLAGLNDKAKRH